MLQVDVGAMTASGAVMTRAGEDLREAGQVAVNALLAAAEQISDGAASGALGSLMSATSTFHQLADGAVKLLGGVASAGTVYSHADQVLAGHRMPGGC